MKTMTNLEKFGLAAILIIACTFLYMKYLYDPQTRVLQTTLKKRNKIVNELNKVRDIPPLFQLKKIIEKDKNTLKIIREKSSNLSVKTGNPDEITQLISEINKIIESNELSVISIIPGQSTAGRFFKWAPFEMDLKGSLNNFMVFMTDIEDLNDAVEIRNLVLENSGENLLRLKFTLRI